MFTLLDLEQAAKLIYREMLPTPQYQWPQLNHHIGASLWVKHENHTPTGAFKVRGGISFIDWVRKSQPNIKGIITATRGNHGQSQARAALAQGIPAKIIVPHGNSTEKNNAMRAFGGEVIEFGNDFDTSRLEALRLSAEQELLMVPPFHQALVLGVATYALELFNAVKELDVIYVPVGCGSGICGLIKVRDLLGLKTEIVGVVSTQATAVKLSFEAGKLIETPSAKTFADGIAVRVPVEEAFDIYSKGASRMVAVSDDEISEAMRLYYTHTHNVAEGAGAAALAAAIQEQGKIKGKNIAVILSGGNVDADVFLAVLKGVTPNTGR